jgi:hypothetical protein
MNFSMVAGERMIMLNFFVVFGGIGVVLGVVLGWLLRGWWEFGVGGRY